MLLHAPAEAVQQNAEWSFALVSTLSSQNLWTADLRGSVIRGWDRSTLTPLSWGKILQTLNQEQLTQGFSHEISDLLQDGARKDDNGIPLELLAAAGEIASKVWDQLPSENEPAE